MNRKDPPTVLLLRSEDGSEPYIDALEAAGLRAVCVPVVSFTHTGTREMLRELSRPDDYSGLVITSPRTTEAWSREPIAETRLPDWVDKPAFAVGPRTAADARRLGLNPQGQDAGSARDLAGYIVRNIARQVGRNGPSEELRPLLFCCGEPHRDELPSVLEEEGIPLKEVVVYRSHVLKAAPLSSPPEWVVFFSPRSMDAARAWNWPWRTIRKAVVGSTSADVIGDYGWAAEVAVGYDEADALAAGIRGSEHARGVS